MEQMLQTVMLCLVNNDKVVVGVSGGSDSMVLLHLLNTARQTTSFELQVVHIEHGIRGAESLHDAQFVTDYCNKNNITCKVVSYNVPKLAKQNKQTIEQCAREIRIKEFEHFLNKGYKLFLAHNKNDQAETVLMHIFRGSGLDGARGIATKPNVFRPLLDYSKEQILAYANKYGVKYVQDSTNASNQYSRNFIRNTIIPQVQTKYPNVVDNLVRFANFCKLSEEFICQSIDDSWLTKTKQYVAVNIKAFAQHPLVIAKVIKMAYNMCGQWADLESKHVLMVTEFVNQCKNGATCNLPHGIVAELRQDKVLFYGKTQQTGKNCVFCLGNNNLPNGTTVKICKMDNNFEFGDGNFYVDYLKIPQNAVWRTRKDGDVFNKLGSRGKKKLNDYFTDKKLSLQERNNTILLASGNNVLLVLGYDVSESIKIDSSTQEIIKIDYVNIQ